jgi:UDP:flavonoid glycosyltransferase YjiC (YdhE family)
LAGDAALRLLVDDGAGRVPFGYDLVWWPAPFGEREAYRHFTGAVITGSEAVPLHAGLPRWHPDGSGRTAISLGGGVIPGPLAEAMRRLDQRAWWTAFSATGDWVPETWHRIPPGRFWAGASQCDRLIVAGGVSALEAAAVGVPCVVVAFVENQYATLAWARAAGVPAINAIEPRDADELAGALDQALRAARPLPPLMDGAPHVAARLAAMAHRVPA